MRKLRHLKYLENSDNLGKYNIFKRFLILPNLVCSLIMAIFFYRNSVLSLNHMIKHLTFSGVGMVIPYQNCCKSRSRGIHLYFGHNPLVFLRDPLLSGGSERVGIVVGPAANGQDSTVDHLHREERPGVGHHNATSHGAGIHVHDFCMPKVSVELEGVAPGNDNLLADPGAAVALPAFIQRRPVLGPV